MKRLAMLLGLIILGFLATGQPQTPEGPVETTEKCVDRVLREMNTYDPKKPADRGIANVIIRLQCPKNILEI